MTLASGVRAASLHAPLLVLLVASRPLIADGSHGDALELVWRSLVLLAAAALLIEAWIDGRRTWHCGPAGAAAAAVLILLAPAALRSPLHETGLETWTMWAINGVFAVWLAQVAPGRERLLAGALIAGLVGEATVALGQWTWWMPAFAERLQAGDAPALLTGSAFAGASVDLLERVQHGGVFGTFAQGNALGGYLVLVVPIAFGLGLRRDARALHHVALAVGVAGLATLSLTNSKGAWLALLAAATVVGWSRTTGWLRMAMPIAVAAAIAALLALPQARNALAASAAVRIDYWRGAGELIAERPLAGHGLRGFSAEFPRVMPLGAEPSRYVHCEPLEAAVDGGVIVGVALVVLLGLLVVGHAHRAATATRIDPADDRSERWAPIVLLLALPYAQAMGLFDVGDWPGGRTVIGEMGWSLAIAALMTGVCVAGRGIASPPAVAVRLGLVAIVLHTLIDYDLHQAGVVGTLVAVTGLVPGPRRATLGRTGLIAASLGLIAIGTVFTAIAQRERALRDAESLIGEARFARVAEEHRRADATTAWRSLARRLGDDPASAPEALITDARQRAWALCRATPRADSDLELSAIALWPPGPECLVASGEAAVAHPHSALARAMLAEDLRAVGRWDEALSAMRTAIALAPAYIPCRLRFVDLLRDAARRLPARADELEAEARDAAAEARRLEPLVHRRNRQ